MAIEIVEAGLPRHAGGIKSFTVIFSSRRNAEFVSFKLCGFLFIDCFALRPDTGAMGRRARRNLVRGPPRRG